MLSVNPADAVELPQQPKRRPRALTSDQAAALRYGLQEGRHEALFLLLLVTGLRPSEALGLTWADLDLDAGRLVVRRKLHQKRGEVEAGLEDPKTEGSEPVVPIPPSVVPVLRQHRVRQGQERLRAGSAYRMDPDLVFRDELGRPLAHRGVVTAFKAALTRAKLPKEIRLDDLRHTFATLTLAAGVHVKIVSTWLGHASTKMTWDVDSHALPAMAEEAAARIEAAVFGAS